jgi:drug/metabolite transporter (DMT)-like permease
MAALWLAIFSAVFAAFANIFARRLMRIAPTKDMISINFGLMFGLLLPAAPFLWSFSLTWMSFLFVMTAATLDAVANYCYFKSFEDLDVVTASSILSLSPAFALVISPLFPLSTAGISFLHVIAIFIIVIGLWLLSKFQRENYQLNKYKRKGYLSFLWPVASAIFFSLSLFILKGVFSSGSINPYSYYLVRAGYIAIITWVLVKPDLRWVNRHRLAGTTGRLVLVVFQWLLLLTALESGHPVFVKALSDIAPLFVLIFAWPVLAEKPVKGQVIGAIIVIVGMMLMTLA